LDAQRSTIEQTSRTVTRMEVTVESLSKIEPRVKDLEDSRERARGAAFVSKTIMAGAGGIFGALSAIIAQYFITPPKP